MRLKLIDQLLAAALVLAMPATASAGDAYSPPPGTANASPNAFGRATPGAGRPVDPNNDVLREDLAPVMADDGSGVPLELWNGLSINDIEALFAGLEIPPRSPVLHSLFKRLITASGSPPAGSKDGRRFLALRLEALDRSGLTGEASSLFDQSPPGSDPALDVMKARAAIGANDREHGCALAQSFAASQSTLEGRLKGEAILISAYCAAAAGNVEAAGLQAQLAREQGIESSPGLDALELMAVGAKPKIAKDAKIGLLDWQILSLAGSGDLASIIPGASPGLLATITRSTAADPRLKLLAGERAAALNAISVAELAGIYRAQPAGRPLETSSTPDAADQLAAAERRAETFKAAEAERTPAKKARFIRSYLDDARRAGLYWPALQAITPAAAAVQRVPELGWFAETGIETALAAGDFDAARAWASAGGATSDGSHGHWLALIDLADPNLSGEARARNLPALETLTARGRFNPSLLHRLATVLDALDIQVPIPLWEQASRTPQPNDGHLPETGVLAKLTDAAKKKEFGNTVLLSMKALGPTGAEGAHMIALGDGIRALRRAGLDAEARQLGLEALFAAWPRATGT